MNITEKKCSRCCTVKPISEFHIDNSMKHGYKSWCKSCVKEEYLLNRNKRSETTKKWKIVNKAKCRDYDRTAKTRKAEFIEGLKTPCRKCGESRLYVIDFHHVDPQTKVFSVAGSTRKYESILEESKKCICLCSNCHKEFHHLYGMNPQNPKENLYKYLKGECEDV